MALIKTDGFQSSGFECARCMAGLSFSDIEGATGIKAGRIASFESGKSEPSASEQEILAAIFGVLPSFFTLAWAKPPTHSYNISFNSGTHHTNK